MNIFSNASMYQDYIRHSKQERECLQRGGAESTKPIWKTHECDIQCVGYLLESNAPLSHAIFIIFMKRAGHERVRRRRGFPEGVHLEVESGSTVSSNPELVAIDLTFSMQSSDLVDQFDGFEQSVDAACDEKDNPGPVVGDFGPRVEVFRSSQGLLSSRRGCFICRYLPHRGGVVSIALRRVVAE